MAEPCPATLAVEGFLRRYGMRDLSPAELAQFVAMAERVGMQTASVTRMPEKTDEPAHVFRVATKT